MANFKPQDIQKGTNYHQIDNGNPVEVITNRTAGAFQQLPRRGDGVDIIEHNSGKKISGYVTKITHNVTISGGGAVDENLAHTINVDIEK